MSLDRNFCLPIISGVTGVFSTQLQDELQKTQVADALLFQTIHNFLAHGSHLRNE
jgi:hypothetical protein